jgi:pimeloyl-ACP methyl ester carboxylesterase
MRPRSTGSAGYGKESAMSNKSLYRSPAGEKEVMALYNKILARWPVPNETIYVPTRHGSTFIIASGEKSAPPLVLLHGASSNALSWIGEVQGYGRYFRTYAVDTPGEPGKSAPDRPAWKGPAYAEWLEDVFNYLQISRGSLVGLSQGGWTAIRFAASHPEQVVKMVLLSPAGIIPERTSFLLRAIFLALLGRRGAKAITRLTFGREQIDREALMYMETIMAHFRPRIDPMGRFTDEELKRLGMPVLLLGGAKDVIRDVNKISARLEGLLPRLRSQIYPEKGHVLINLADRIIPFLRSGG